MRISDWSSDVCSSDLSFGKLRVLLLSEFGAFRSLCLLPGGKRISEAIKIDADPEEIINALKITPKRAGGSGRNIKYAYAEAIFDLRTDPRLDTLNLNRSEEHTSEIQSLMRISYAVFCLKKKNTHHNT